MVIYLKFFRWPNILIIILTQVLLKTIVFDYIFWGLGIGYPISNFWFMLLVISTVFVAIAGYIGNDIADIEIDKINRPERPLCSGSISISQAQTLQLFFELFGLLLGFAVSYHIGNVSLAGIHLLIIILMRLYAKSLKCKGLIGNIVVAFSSAMVPAIVWIFGIYALRGTLYEVNFYLSMINTITAFYVAFAFWFTLIREIIKDIEDRAGDIKSNCHTLAVRMPLQKLKYWIIGLSFIGLIGILIFQFVLLNSSGLSSRLLFIGSFSSIVIILGLLVIPKLITAKESIDFRKLGNYLKIIILAGILNILFLLAW